MRLQLKRSGLVLALSAIACATLVGAPAHADESEVDLAGTLFYESGGPLSMTVITPSARVHIVPIEELRFNVGWDADVVSGASVAIVDAPSPEPDVVSTATQLSDFRNVFNVGAEIASDFGSIRASYAYGFENDYRGHTFTLGARAELFERNTLFDFSYARAWDSVCDVYQPEAREAVDRRRLTSSSGCFSAMTDYTARDLSLQTFQGSWTQLWAPILTTQLTVSAQLVDGFQSNPYRSVWLGRSAAQEHHPEHRARYAASLGARIWIDALSSALQLSGRAYRDTWDVMSLSAEVAWELVIDGAFRARARGRYYTQGAAAFYSDDYALQPMGAYFTGDRELSSMSTLLVGATISYAITGEQPVMGFLSEFDILLRAEWLHSEFPDFHYGEAGVPNNNALIATLGLEGHF